VHHVGIETFLTELADHIEADFKRWPEFDKSPRVASHVPGGVIELMPTADNALYGFKYVNGHPKNTRTGQRLKSASMWSASSVRKVSMPTWCTRRIMFSTETKGT